MCVRPTSNAMNGHNMAPIIGWIQRHGVDTAWPLQPSMPQTTTSFNVSMREHEQRLLHERLVAQALVQAHGDVGDQRDGQRVLRQHVALEDVERQAREPGREDAAGMRRVDAPVDDDQRDERGPDHRQPVRQRQHLRDEREQHREGHRPARFAAREVHGFFTGGAASTASASGVAAAAG